MSMNQLMQMETEKISVLLAKLSIPSIVAMFVSAIYTVVDRMFIGQFVNEHALAGIAITFPLVTIIFAFGSLVGIGSTTVMANSLGAKDLKRASRGLCVGLSYGLVCLLIVLPIIDYNRHAILLFFGGNEHTLEYAEEYTRIFLLGSFFQLIAFILSYAVRQEGKPFFSMASMLCAAALNIILDYIFIVPLQWGVKGAAYATLIAQVTCFLILLSYYLRGKSVLTFKWRYFIPSVKLVNQINKIGLSNFIINAGITVSTILMNRSLESYGGTAAITSIAAVASLMTLVNMPIFGLRQGMLPIIGYNYGAKNMKRVYGAFFTASKVAALFSLLCFILLELFPSFFLQLFIQSDSDTMPLAVTTLRISILMMPLLFLNFLGLSFFQSTERGWLSSAVSLFRQLIIVPFILLLPLQFGVKGIFMATPLSDFIAILVTMTLFRKAYRSERSRIVQQK